MKPTDANPDLGPDQRETQSNRIEMYLGFAEERPAGTDRTLKERMPPLCANRKEAPMRKPPTWGSHRISGLRLELALKIAFAIFRLFWILVLISRL